MRRIRSRALSVLLIAMLVLFGMVTYLLRYIDNGKDWATYFSRANSESVGQLLDRNGIVLAYFNGGEENFSPDTRTRISNYHVTGDYWGRTGTGVITKLWKSSEDYSLLTGTTRKSSSSMSLCIDARLNNTIYRLLDRDAKASVMLCNYRTGELLAMVSTPTVDPLRLDGEIPDGAYLNRCLSATYTPGSIFKLVTSAAALETLPEIESERFYCYGEHEIAGVPITCDSTHFEQSFEKALSNSCNIAFAQIAVRLGQNTMLDYVKQYGLLDSQSLNGIGCSSGSYPTEFVGDPELGWSGIGQSTDTVCPYAMLRFICAIANDGELIEPNLLLDNEPTSVQLMRKETAQRLQEMMRFDVIDHYGGEERFPKLELCAKTGTAELGDGDSHSWFVGFLADEEHPYAFVTLIERGGYGLDKAGKLTNEMLQWAIVHIE